MRPLCVFLMCFCLTPVLGGIGCSGAIDKVVDSRVANMVADENAQLPRNVGNGVKLVRIDYQDDSNKLVMNYSVPDKQEFNANFDRVKKETNDEVYNNGSLSSAFDHDIKLFHQFYTDESLSGKPFKSFQTPKPRD